MKYTSFKIGEITKWSAQPVNWEELMYSLEHEQPFLEYNPNEHEADPTLKNMFL